MYNTIKQTKKYTKRTMSKDLVFWISLSSAVLIGILGTFNFFYVSYQLKKDFLIRADDTTEKVAYAFAQPVWNNDNKVCGGIAKAMLGNPLTAIRIISDYGDTVFDNFPPKKNKLIYLKKKMFWETNYVGSLELLFDDKEIWNKQRKIIENTIVIIALMIVANILGAFFFAGYLLTKPMARVIEGVKKIADGDYDNPLEPVAQQDLNTIIDEVNSMAKQIGAKTVQLVQSEEQAYIGQKLAEKAKKSVREFLDNSGQGFLSFGADLLVDYEYSSECEHIFKQTIAKKNISELLYGEDKDGKTLFAKNIYRIFNESNVFRQNLYISLLPSEFSIATQNIQAEYKIVNNRMMLILTDVTLQKKLENEIDSERKKLKFVVTTVRESQDFFEIINDFKQFCEFHLPALLSSDNDMSEELILEELYRQVHTFKGLFGQQGFLELPKMLHDMETKLNNFQKNPNEFHTLLKNDPIANDIFGLKNVTQLLNDDLKIIDEYIGGDFLENQGNVIIGFKQADKLYNQAKQIFNMDDPFEMKEVRQLLSEIISMRQINLKNILRNHMKNAYGLAERLGKKIFKNDVEGDNVFVESTKYVPFFKTLVHVFRNSIDHGIETIDERDEHGKSEIAQLRCSIQLQQKQKQMLIQISDDGKGLDIENLRKLAVEKKIYSKDVAENKTDNEISQLVFAYKFSTKQKTTNLSGRGVGLSAVYNELKKISGSVEIVTKQGSGTTFNFTVPFIDNPPK